MQASINWEFSFSFLLCSFGGADISRTVTEHAVQDHSGPSGQSAARFLPATLSASLLAQALSGDTALTLTTVLLAPS